MLLKPIADHQIESRSKSNCFSLDRPSDQKRRAREWRPRTIGSSAILNYIDFWHRFLLNNID